MELWASPRAFAPGVLLALAALGYVVAERSRLGADGWTPEIRLASDGQLDRLARETAHALPTLVLAGRRARAVPEALRAGIVGTVLRPATLRDVYRVLQSALEEHPRAVPRVPTSLPARCVAGDVDAPGAIVSLSERGCLLRSPQTWQEGRVSLWFALPEQGLVQVLARPVHRQARHVGLAFHEVAEATRSAIARFVESSLLAGRAGVHGT